MRPILTYSNWNRINESSKDPITLDKAIKTIKSMAVADGTGTFNYVWPEHYEVADDKIIIDANNGWGGDDILIELVFNNDLIDDDVFSAWNEVSDLLPSYGSMSSLNEVIVNWKWDFDTVGPVDLKSNRSAANVNYKYNGEIYDHFSRIFDTIDDRDEEGMLTDIENDLKKLSKKYTRTKFIAKLKKEHIPVYMNDFEELFKLNTIHPTVLLDLDEMDLTIDKNEIWELIDSTTY